MEEITELLKKIHGTLEGILWAIIVLIITVSFFH